MAINHLTHKQQLQSDLIYTFLSLVEWICTNTFRITVSTEKDLVVFCLFWYRQFPVVTILKQKVGNCLFLLSIYNDDPFQNTNTNTPFFLQIPQTKAILSSILSTIFYGIVHTSHSPGSISIRYHNSNPSHNVSQTLFDIKFFFFWGVCGGLI